MADEPDQQSSPHYHPVGITFHWVMAALIFVQLWWGWRTTFLAAGYEKADAYVVHAQLGAAILVIVLARLGWRIIAPFVAPRLEKIEDLPGWQRLAAELVHWLLYVMMVVLPVSGVLMMAATAPETVERAIGLTLFRDLSLAERAQIEHIAENVHLASVWAIMGLIAMHVGAALKHHFIDRDDVLARMIPALGPRPEPGGKPSATRRAKTTNAAR